MKILYVISTLGGGGAESQLCYFVDCLKKYNKNIDFSIIALKRGGVLENRLKESGIDYRIINSSSLIKNALILHRVLRKEKYDIVHAHMLYSDVCVRFASLGLSCKVVATHHGLGKWKKKALILLDKMTKHLVDSFIMVSDESKRIRITREKYPEYKTKVIYNGISSRFYADKAKSLSNPVIMGTIARFTDNKQIDMMIRIVDDLRDKHDLYLEIVGDGENAEKLQELVENRHLKDRICFLGWQDDVLPIIQRWNVFLMCSINEDLPVSLLETMAQGIVPVASDVGGIPLVLNNGRNGVLCDSRDITTFEKGITELLSDNDEYSKKSLNCIEYIRENYSIEQSVAKTISLYQAVLGENY